MQETRNAEIPVSDPDPANRLDSHFINDWNLDRKVKI